MTFIHLPQRWNRQPQIPVGIDATSPFAKGLVRAFLPPYFIDLAKRTAVVRGSEITVGADNGYQSFIHPSAIGSTGITFKEFNILSGASMLLFQRRFSSGNNGWMDVNIDSQIEHFYWDGKVYSSAFGNARWISALGTNIDYQLPHTFGCSVTAAKQIATLNGSLFFQDNRALSLGIYPNPRLLIGSSGYSYNGALYVALMWDRALSFDELVSISNNPWQIFAPLNRIIYFPVSTGGLTSVQQDSFVRWNIIQAIHSDTALTWNVRIAIDNDIPIEWNVITGALADTPLHWNVLTSAQNTLSIKWNLLERIIKDSKLYWNILTTTQQDAVSAWNTLSAIHSDCAVRWNALTATQQSTLLSWNLSTAATQFATLQWNSLSDAQRDAVLYWSTLSEVFSASNDAVLHWDVLTATQQYALLRWNLLSAVDQALSARWHILQSLDASIATRWDIATDIANELTAHWDITTTALADTTLHWNMLAISENEIELRWQIGDTSTTPAIRVFLVRGENRVFTVAGSIRSF